MDYNAKHDDVFFLGELAFHHLTLTPTESPNNLTLSPSLSPIVHTATEAAQQAKNASTHESAERAAGRRACGPWGAKGGRCGTMGKGCGEHDERCRVIHSFLHCFLHYLFSLPRVKCLTSKLEKLCQLFDTPGSSERL